LDLRGPNSDGKGGTCRGRDRKKREKAGKGWEGTERKGIEERHELETGSGREEGREGRGWETRERKRRGCSLFILCVQKI